MDRRRFSHLLASGFLLPWVGAIGVGGSQDLNLSGLVSDLDAARVVGRIYLQSHPHIDEHTLKLDLGLGSCSSATGLEQTLREQIHKDFCSSRTVVVEGWLLWLL